LEDGIRPRITLPQALLNVFVNARIVNVDEALEVLSVLADDPVAKAEDVKAHRRSLFQ
jgi:hypothetical protein